MKFCITFCQKISFWTTLSNEFFLSTRKTLALIFSGLPRGYYQGGVCVCNCRMITHCSKSDDRVMDNAFRICTIKVHTHTDTFHSVSVCSQWHGIAMIIVLVLRCVSVCDKHGKTIFSLLLHYKDFVEVQFRWLFCFVFCLRSPAIMSWFKLLTWPSHLVVSMLLFHTRSLVQWC